MTDAIDRELARLLAPEDRPADIAFCNETLLLVEADRRLAARLRADRRIAYVRFGGLAAAGAAAWLMAQPPGLLPGGGLGTLMVAGLMALMLLASCQGALAED